MHLSFKIIFDIVYKDFSLIKFFFENIIINFTNSFFNFIHSDAEQIVLTTEKDEKDKENYFNSYFEIYSKLLNWIKMDYHPRIIHSDIVSTMQIFKFSKDNKILEPALILKMKRILNFVDQVDKKFNEFNVLFPDAFNFEDRKLIERLNSVNEQIKEYF